MIEEKKAKSKKFIYGKGARKTAVAQVRLYVKGKGAFTVNGKPFDQYFPTENLQKTFLAALNIANQQKDVDIDVKVHSGGLASQAEACRHGLSRALVELDSALRPALKAQGFLTRDPRVKERKKPGLKRARRAPQWSKR